MNQATSNLKFNLALQKTNFHQQQVDLLYLLPSDYQGVPAARVHILLGRSVQSSCQACFLQVLHVV